MSIHQHVADLVEYASIHLSLDEADRLYSRNALYNLLNVHTDEDVTVDRAALSALEVPDTLLTPLSDYAVQNGIIEEEYRALFETALMGTVTMKPSEVNRKFEADIKALGVRKALLNFYDQSIKSNYIKMTDVKRNLWWLHECDGAPLEITVNLSKPEKDNKEIARLKAMPATGFPKCMLCKENVNYQGRLNFPARQTLRFVPLTLNGERWYMQYSPYVYYNEHCIVFSEQHAPMTMNRTTFIKFADFVDTFPCYMIGSNACIPIVGGSILTHEHYQGGEHVMPMHHAKPVYHFTHERFPEVDICITDWYNSNIRLITKNREQMIDAAEYIFNFWQEYSDESVGVIARTTEGHNAVTPILRKLEDGTYSLDMLLRNNRTDETYPDGIFHAHPEYHNIKKEGIGLIEAMGLFILPGRLQKESAGIAEYLTGKRTDKDYLDEANVLYKHRGMIEELIASAGTACTDEQADKLIKAYIGGVCRKILDNTAVFKKDEKGVKAFFTFMEKAGFKRV